MSSVGSPPSTKQHKVWIDLDNSPHVPFFVPIIDELRQQGQTIVLTSRDNAQVEELVKLHGLETIRIGRHFGRNRLAKILGTLARSVRLVFLMWREQPDIALSHGSRSQIISAFLLGVPSVLIFDYEFTSSTGWIRPTWVMAPDAIPTLVTDANAGRSLRYPGIKEDVYVATFRPDSSLRAKLGIAAHELVVTVRPPASEAHYHNPVSDELLRHVIDYLTQESAARVILLPRTRKQESALRKEWREFITQGRIHVPPHVVDGLNLIWNSDLVISGGGTMNREAAALGVPVYSIFRGNIGAVDKYLVSEGRLVLIEATEDIRRKVKLVPRASISPPDLRRSRALSTIMANISVILESESRQSRPLVVDAAAGKAAGNTTGKKP